MFNQSIWKEKSVAVKAGVRMYPPPPDGNAMVFPGRGKEGWEQIRLDPKPLSFKVDRGMTVEEIERQAVAAIDALIFHQIRTDERVNKIVPTDDPKRDLFYMIAAVENNNAEFGLFACHPDDPLPTLPMGYPVVLNRTIPKGTVLGGMWSDSALVVRPNVLLFHSSTEGLMGQVEVAFAMKHPESFSVCERGVK